MSMGPKLRVNLKFKDFSNWTLLSAVLFKSKIIPGMQLCLGGFDFYSHNIVLAATLQFVEVITYYLLFVQTIFVLIALLHAKSWEEVKYFWVSTNINSSSEQVSIEGQLKLKGVVL